MYELFSPKLLPAEHDRSDPPSEHMLLKATTTEVDQEAGTFEALVSAWVEDREHDVIAPSAFDKTIHAWQSSGKRIPLLFEHSVKSIGSIDPFSMYANGEGLVVSGEVDRETDEGRQVWRMVKNNTASFSIGFASESRPREGGKGRVIFEVDLLEISATSTPVHPSARVLSWKSTKRDEGTILIQTKDGGFERVPVSEPFWWEIEEERERKAWLANRPVEVITFNLG